MYGEACIQLHSICLIKNFLLTFRSRLNKQNLVEALDEPIKEVPTIIVHNVLLHVFRLSVSDVELRQINLKVILYF